MTVVAGASRATSPPLSAVPQLSGTPGRGSALAAPATGAPQPLPAATLLGASQVGQRTDLVEVDSALPRTLDLAGGRATRALDSTGRAPVLRLTGAVPDGLRQGRKSVTGHHGEAVVPGPARVTRPSAAGVPGLLGER